MTLHIFNPEHDLALAFGGERFTAPKAGREMRRCLGFLPAFWAGREDMVMVDDLDMALDQAAPFRKYFPKVRFVPSKVAKSPVSVCFDNIDRVEVWGWDAAVRRQLLREGVPERLLPSEEQVTGVRYLSSRVASIRLLEDIVRGMPDTLGQRVAARSLKEVNTLLDLYGRIVLKMPWSSSGRGVRYINERPLTDSQEGFVRNTIGMQGCVIVEPFYDRVMDLGVEFVADGTGWVEAEGLSMFSTVNGAYTGNLLLPEEDKWKMLSPYIDENLLREVVFLLQSLLGVQTTRVYAGQLGVDMMIVKQGDRYLLHPCVEVNLRRTMGHVALDITRRTRGDFTQMQVLFDGIYRLRLR